ncbi:hypothetical protein C5167_002018 [Papaver somniferum]|uniref:ubiquitinyl hydrolase 1 n=1 Tax=Papaver somniferum TaxID=3469 RepID=A0A4Y7L0H0_PAPSO|nr:hypothetical protein C5167_002018 [Papaver somniferum]
MPPRGQKKSTQPGDLRQQVPTTFNNRPQVVHFRRLEKPTEDGFSLEMSGMLTYEDVTKRIASHLGLDDPRIIRLTLQNPHFRHPKSQPIRDKSVAISYNEKSNFLYYEVLTTPIQELPGSKTLNVTFRHAIKDEVFVCSITLPNLITVGYMINELKKKVDLSHPNAELRLFEVLDHKIRKIPEEEKILGPLDRLIHVCHIDEAFPGQFRQFGKPFFFVIHGWETAAVVRARIQMKLQIPGTEFSKWKLKYYSYGKGQQTKVLSLGDNAIVSRLFQGKNLYENCREYLCLEHFDRQNPPRRTDVASASLNPLNREVKKEEEEVPKHKKQKLEALVCSIIKHEDEKLVHSENTEGAQSIQVSVEKEKAEYSAPKLNDNERSALVTQSSEIDPLNRFPTAGQHFEVVQHHQGIVDDNFEDVGGFSILKSQASLYKKIWLKYGHIATSHVLKNLYSTQVTLVGDIMTSIVDMHNHRFSEVKSTMIELWENKIKMAEKLEFNVGWLREWFEGVKKGFHGEQKLNAALLEKDLSLQVAKARLMAINDELKKAQENVLALVSKISPLFSEKQIYLERGKRLLFDGFL